VDFAAATFADGGVLLHLPSGDFFRLDPIGAAVWQMIGEGTGADSTIAKVAGTLQLPAKEAREVLERVLAQAGTLHGRRPAVLPAFRDDERSLSLQEGPHTLMSLDKRSLTLTVADALRDRSDEDMAAAFRVFVPKVYGRWFPLAMHASAMTAGDRTILFCGESGAGKTTTVRTFAEEVAGCRVLSEDVVVFREESGLLMMIDDAEAAIHSWMVDATAALIERRESHVDVAALRRALDVTPGRIPVHRAIFLNAGRRQGRLWSLRHLPPALALSNMLLHSFLHSPDQGVLRAHLHFCRALAAQIDPVEATAIPAGLDALRRCCQAQIETIAS
jgi:hypothetical protein